MRVTRTEIDALAERIGAEFRPEKVILFGSHAYGTPSEDSDVDLLVIMEHSSTGIAQALEIVHQVSSPTGRIGPVLTWEKHGCGRRIGRVLFEGARSRPAYHWCNALRGEPGSELGPEARGVVSGEGLHGDVLIHPGKENAQFVHASAAPLHWRRD